MRERGSNTGGRVTGPRTEVEPMQPLRLYLAGPAGAGKSTVAEILAEHFGFHRVGLGDIVRRECARRGLDPTRRNLQAVGLRGSVPHRLAALAAGMAVGTQAPAVVEGVRLRAEAEYLAGLGYIGVHVEAPEPLRISRVAVRDGSNFVPDHPTQSGASALPVDLVLTNDTDDRTILLRRVRLTVAQAVLLTVERAYRLA